MDGLVDLEILRQKMTAMVQMMRLSAVMPIPMKRPLWAILDLVGFSSVRGIGSTGAAGSALRLPLRSGSLEAPKLLGSSEAPIAPSVSAFGAS